MPGIEPWYPGFTGWRLVTIPTPIVTYTCGVLLGSQSVELDAVRYPADKSCNSICFSDVFHFCLSFFPQFFRLRRSNQWLMQFEERSKSDSIFWLGRRFILL
jgi:hypothetical protein